MEIHDHNWIQIEPHLGDDDRSMLPVRSTEQHGFPSLGTNAILAEGVEAMIHRWNNTSKTATVAGRYSEVQLHDAGVENFRWTRIDGVDVPDEEILPLPRKLTGWLSRTAMCEAAPDGSYGGRYRRAHADVGPVWDTGVLEVRELIDAGREHR